jgi:hypothetical protein
LQRRRKAEGAAEVILRCLTVWAPKVSIHIDERDARYLLNAPELGHAGRVVEYGGCIVSLSGKGIALSYGSGALKRITKTVGKYNCREKAPTMERPTLLSSSTFWLA